jgi:activating signal cointegrator complex subunit 2
VEACLNHYSDDVEVVISRLLDDQLPPELQRLDRSMTTRLPVINDDAAVINKNVSQTEERPMNVAPPPLPERRNVYDGDEFDVYSGAKLAPGTAHQGKKGYHCHEFIKDYFIINNFDFKASRIRASFWTNAAMTLCA